MAEPSLDVDFGDEDFLRRPWQPLSTLSDIALFCWSGRERTWIVKRQADVRPGNADKLLSSARLNHDELLAVCQAVIARGTGTTAAHAWDLRRTRESLTFGSGFHNCIGNILAKTKFEKATVQIFAAIDVKILVDQPDLLSRYNSRGFESLPVRFTL
ncbi:hypothetical protein [Novosphingobium colocasiae]|uniref:hypothetical protein n=1 Tax=Novosphingobium colocasiae TaxID=1256513 RepID=UPI001675002C|nr:hypothetical protein [Novosphingobium colocasiae]